jgi:hypothetical protein
MFSERETERRAEEPRECNQPKGLDAGGVQDIEMQGRNKHGSSPSAGKVTPVDTGEAGPVVSQSPNRRNEV